MIPKFRAWDKSNSEMLKVDCINWYMDEIVIYPDNELAFSMKLENIELMQYTGLKDKNGVEIFEGDILFHPLQGRREVFYPYSENVASYGLRNIDNGFGSTLQDSHAVWEVIGNIHENPELEVEE